MLSVCVCVWCLEHTVLDGILEKHQSHWHHSWTLVVVIQLCLHESLEVGQITEVFVHPELVQEITCQSIKTMNTTKKTITKTFLSQLPSLLPNIGGCLLGQMPWKVRSKSEARFFPSRPTKASRSI